MIGYVCFLVNEHQTAARRELRLRVRNCRPTALMKVDSCDAPRHSAFGPGCVKTPNSVESGGTPTLPRMEIVAYNAFCEVNFSDPISEGRFYTAWATWGPSENVKTGV